MLCCAVLCAVVATSSAARDHHGREPVPARAGRSLNSADLRGLKRPRGAPRDLGLARAQNARAETPPMGWRSWNAMHADVTQAKMERVMDVMAERTRKVSCRFAVPRSPATRCLGSTVRVTEGGYSCYWWGLRLPSAVIYLL